AHDGGIAVEVIQIVDVGPGESAQHHARGFQDVLHRAVLPPRTLHAGKRTPSLSRASEHPCHPIIIAGGAPTHPNVHQPRPGPGTRRQEVLEDKGAARHTGTPTAPAPAADEWPAHRDANGESHAVLPLWARKTRWW